MYCTELQESLQSFSDIADENDALAKHQVQHGSRLSRLHKPQQQQQQQRLHVPQQQKKHISREPNSRKGPRFDEAKQDHSMKQQVSPRKRPVGGARLWMC